MSIIHFILGAYGAFSVIIGVFLFYNLFKVVKKYYEDKESFVQILMNSFFEYTGMVNIISSNRVQNRINALERFMIFVYRILLNNPEWKKDVSVVDLPLVEPEIPDEEINNNWTNFVLSEQKIFYNIVYVCFWFFVNIMVINLIPHII